MFFAMQKNGAPGGDRTHDPLLRRQLLYPLSYQGNVLCNLTRFRKITMPDPAFFRRNMQKRARRHAFTFAPAPMFLAGRREAMHGKYGFLRIVTKNGGGE